MTPSAPTAAWRKVVEEYFSRLVEDLEQQVESEVESRVSVAVDAVVRGAVSDAAAESRRAVAEELNQAARRLRQAGSAEELYTVLADVTSSFCDEAAVFSVSGRQVRAERMRRPAEIAAGEAQATQNLPALEFSAADAAAFSTAIESLDPVIAISTPAEVTAALVELFKHEVDEKVYLFPLMARGEAAGVLYASGGVQAPALELLSGVAGLQLETLVRLPAALSQNAALATAAGAAASVEQEPKPADQLFHIAPPVRKPPEVDAASPAGAGSKEHREWWDLSREQQHMHLAAQRFARVQVAEMRLERPDMVRAGRARRDIYGALRELVDRAREAYRVKFVSGSPTMVDYLHLEMVRSLADDDANMLGPGYPGPLV